MARDTFLAGTEAHTLELGLSIDAARARALAGAELEPEIAGHAARADVLFFAMRGLGVSGVPFGRIDYGEALFRLSVRWRDRPAWLALACDLDARAVQVLGRWLVRYPVRAATFEIDGRRFATSAAEGRLSVEAEPSEDAAPAEPARPMLVRDGGVLYRIPWREEPAPWRRWARCEVRDDALARATFGAAPTFDASGVVHRGRVHRCGVARRAA